MHWPCDVLSMLKLSFPDPGMYCPCLSCHSFTLLCTGNAQVVIHWPCYVLSMSKLSFIDPAMYCPCLCCNSNDHTMYSPCLSCHSSILLCTVHVYVVIHWPRYALLMLMLSFIDSAMYRYCPCWCSHSLTAMYCPCLYCHSLTPLCTTHV